MSDAITEEDVQKLMDMFGPEDLHPDLVPHIEERAYGPCLHHPLVIEVLYRKELHKRINRMFEHKTAELAKAVAEKDWAKYVFIHERPYRFPALTTVIWTFNDGDMTPALWDLVGQVWVDSENIYQNLEEWQELWDGVEDTGARASSMDDEERAALAALPDVIQVWRGFAHNDAELGMSWTTDMGRAIWFANRFAADTSRVPMVVHGTVQKKNVFAHFLGRNESEIVTLGEYVDNVTRIPIGGH